MLTEKSLKTLGSVIKAYHCVCMTSLNFNLSQNQFTTPQSPLHRWGPPLTSFCVLLYSLLNSFTLLQLISSPHPVQPVDFIWLVIYTSARLWGVVSQLRVHILNPSIAYFYNCLVHFHRRLIQTDLLKDKSDPKSFDCLNFILLYYTQLSLTFTLGVIGMLILQPMRPVFLYSTIANSSSQLFPPDLTFVLCLAIEVWITSSVMHTIIIDGAGLITIYVLVTSSYLYKLNRRFSRHSMNPLSAISFYSSLTLLEKIHKDSLGFSTPVFFTAIGIHWTLGTIGALRLFHAVSPADYLILSMTSIGGGTALLGMIHFSGNLPLHGRRFISLVAHTYDDRYAQRKGMRKYMISKGLSLRLFGIRCHPIRLIKHNSIYLYFGALINFIVTFLTAYPTFPD